MVSVTHNQAPCTTCSGLIQLDVGMENAVLDLLHWAHPHLDKESGIVRIFFVYFSSAFNTILPLRRMRVDPCLVSWVLDRPQSVRLKDIISDTGVSNTRAPQWIVLPWTLACSVVSRKLDCLPTFAEKPTSRGHQHTEKPVQWQAAPSQE